MRRLLIDPLSDPVVIAVADDRQIVSVAIGSHKDRTVALDLAVSQLMPIVGINEIVTISGPGNFTAIRAGIGFARGLALALGVPSRSIGIFDIDAQLLDTDAAVLIRDARGGRVYVAEFKTGKLGETALNFAIDINVTEAISADLAGASPLDHTPEERLHAFAQAASENIGYSPAKAQYVRPADAAPSTIKVPKLLNE